MKKLLFIFLFITLNLPALLLRQAGIKLQTLNCYAQQYPLYSQYLFDGLTINPALAGNTNSIKGTLTYRKQFMGLPGSPLTQAFTVHGPLRIRSMGVGLKAVRDKLGVTSQTSISAVYAYHLALAKGKLSFGLEGGLLSQSTDFPVLIKTDADDPLLQNKENVMIPDAAFGVYYHTGKFFTGVSIAHLLQSRLNYTGSIAQLSNHYFLTGGYSFNAGENIQLKPSLLLKYVVGAPVQIDVNLNAVLKEKLTIGGGYRTDGEILVLFQYQFKDRIKFGYAFDYTISKLGSYNNGSHEIMLSYSIKLKDEEILKERKRQEEELKRQEEEARLIAEEELRRYEEEARLKAEEEEKRQEEEMLLEAEENEKHQEEEVQLESEDEQKDQEEEILLEAEESEKRQEAEALLEAEEEESQQEEEARLKAEEEEKRQEEDLIITEESTMSSESNSVEIKGNITSNGLGLSYVTVKLFKGSNVIDETKTSENGEFSFDIILPEGDYSLYIAKDGFIDRLYGISTINKDNNGIISKNFELIKRRF